MTEPRHKNIAIIGGGPAGLMAAETARAAGLEVDLYEAKGSVGRKFLLAGKGGLNLTHSDPPDVFVRHYHPRDAEVARWLDVFDGNALRAWAKQLGIETVIGSSGRVFPADFKSAPLLRAWVRRLREQGVRFYVKQRCEGWNASGRLLLRSAQGMKEIETDAVILAMGGGSWPQLGSDGAWVSWLGRAGADIAPLKPANCGFDLKWSAHFASRFAGKPVKSVIAKAGDAEQQGEFQVTANGIEGGVVYALSATLRDRLEEQGAATLHLDLAPGREEARLVSDLSRPRGKRSLSEHWRRHAGIEGVKAGLLHEIVPEEALVDPVKLAGWIKHLPLPLVRPRPVPEAISTAGGVRFEALDERLMLRARPGVFCAGEMVDWEAPTGGYLLTACFASGVIAGRGAVEWLQGL